MGGVSGKKEKNVKFLLRKPKVLCLGDTLELILFEVRDIMESDNLYSFLSL